MLGSIRPLAALAVLPVMALSAPAVAAYSVSVSAYSRAGHAGGALCQYNGNSYNGCSNVNTDPSSTGSLSTSGGTSAGATTASATTSQTGTDYYQTLPEATSIAASSDLTTGSLHLQSNNSNGSPASGYGSGGSAGMNDVLHFLVAGASADTVTPISVSFTVDGVMAASAVAGSDTDGSGEFYGGMAFGSSNANFDFLNDASTNYKTTGTFNTYPSSYPGTWTYAADFTSAQYTETYNILGPSADITVSSHATLNCYNGASCNYGDTAKFALVTPTGTSYTSDSGVFLTGGTVSGAVPEPATWEMMLGGFGLVGGAMRRQRRANMKAVLA